jgi:hypothetical protein
MISILSQIWFRMQRDLFPHLERELSPLSDKENKLVRVLELVRVEEFVKRRWWSRGRPEKERSLLARAYVAKMVYNLSTTEDLIDRLGKKDNLWSICGWEKGEKLPSESTFSRAFREFAESGLPQRVHEELLKKYESERLVGHISRDSTDVAARESVVNKPKDAMEPEPKRKRGRPKKGEEMLAKEPSRLERQVGMRLCEILSELPKGCDFGFKKKNGRKYYWRGYKLHVDWADGEIPISSILTSASLHDSQAAIPLAKMSAERVVNLYDLMDSAYDAKEIEEYSAALGHRPIIDCNPRRGKKFKMDPAEKRRYDERSTAERGFSMLKESFGGSKIRVRGYEKVMCHLMFGILALTAERLLNLLM